VASSGRDAGFTLLEMILVLVIAGLVLAVTPPLLSAAMPGLQLKGTARELAAGLRYARDRAVTSGVSSTLSVDLDKHRFRVSGRNRRFELPDGLEYRLVTAQQELTGDRSGAIRFFPDGSSTGGRLTVSHKDRKLEVDVDWLTGRVRILD
jgi:general secretion pathway protein H